MADGSACSDIPWGASVESAAVTVHVKKPCRWKRIPGHGGCTAINPGTLANPVPNKGGASILVTDYVEGTHVRCTCGFGRHGCHDPRIDVGGSGRVDFCYCSEYYSCGD